MSKDKSVKGSMRINYLTGKSRYFILTEKSGCPSAEFRCRGSGLVVTDTRDSSGEQ